MTQTSWAQPCSTLGGDLPHLLTSNRLSLHQLRIMSQLLYISNMDMLVQHMLLVLDSTSPRILFRNPQRHNSDALPDKTLQLTDHASELSFGWRFGWRMPCGLKYCCRHLASLSSSQPESCHRPMTTHCLQTRISSPAPSISVPWVLQPPDQHLDIFLEWISLVLAQL